jgi:hypothetical protein
VEGDVTNIAATLTQDNNKSWSRVFLDHGQETDSLGLSNSCPETRVLQCHTESTEPMTLALTTSMERAMSAGWKSVCANVQNAPCAARLATQIATRTTCQSQKLVMTND